MVNAINRFQWQWHEHPHHLQHYARNPIAAMRRCPHRHPDPHLFNRDRAVRCVDQRSLRQANRAGGDGWGALLLGDRACTVNRADDGTALALGPDLDVELIYVPDLLEENSVQLFGVAVDRQFLIVGEAGKAAQMIVGEDGSEDFSGNTVMTTAVAAPTPVVPVEVRGGA